MSKLRMLAGGVVKSTVGQTGTVSAYVALTVTLGHSRLFKVAGRTDTPQVTELDPVGAGDLHCFRDQVVDDLQPEVVTITAGGDTAAVSEPGEQWVAGLVRRHLRNAESLEVD